MRPVVIMVSGPEGCGKTHFMFTAPEKLTVFDFEGRTEDVKSKFEGKDIEIEEYILPIQWQAKKKTYGSKEYQDFVDQYQEALEDSQSIGVDTGTSLWSIVRAARTEELGAQDLVPYQYGEPNARMQAIISLAKKKRRNLILTQHIRDVYVNDKATGEKEPDGFSHLPNLVDFDIRMELKVTKQGVSTVSTIRKCGLDRSLVGTSYEDLDFETLGDILGG